MNHRSLNSHLHQCIFKFPGQETGKNNLEEYDDKPGIKQLSIQKYVNPMEVRDHVKLVFQNSRELLRTVFGGTLASEQPNIDSVEMFFIDVVAVPPSRFRPVCVNLFI